MLIFFYIFFKLCKSLFRLKTRRITFFYDCVHINDNFIRVSSDQHIHIMPEKVQSRGILRLVKSCH
jgi:hypothetical protein